ncbi:TetR/AcrR family transcriptional regulator [Fictibacillus fluitans]|uniref:TetR/AcrR family transcriptional regulator n=1 Tax=Fictibacillus fluitans TaxID=3058422 RepID=A0ABT8HZ18_9BACL|nr:TetR/AcrR family transcriptional regulator [Fictibacillus sp. NE201]MDN4526021.1 TetR/AcrR family transcriptional regulator [Fictibacillus sp. NE201]
MSLNNTDRRIRRTKRMIRDALTELMEDKGFDAITVRDLTDKADINRGTFYLHYKDKFALLEQCEGEVLEELAQVQGHVKELQLANFYEHFHRGEPLPFIVKLFEYLKENGAFMRVILGPNGDPLFQVKMKDILAEHLLKHMVKKARTEMEVPFEYFKAYVISAHLGVIQEWLFSGMKESPKEIAMTAFKLTFLGPRRAAGLVSDKN